MVPLQEADIYQGLIVTSYRPTQSPSLDGVQSTLRLFAGVVARRTLCLLGTVLAGLSPAMHGQVQGAAGNSPTTAIVLADRSHAVPVVFDASDYDVVKLAARAFSGDIEELSGSKPQVLESCAVPRGNDSAVLIGTIGHSKCIDGLRSSGMLSTRSIDGKWESSITEVIEHPFPGVRRALVIAGSDRRGTAFAVFALSRRLGVSPWNWWADVPVVKRNTVVFDAVPIVEGEPSVRYRGIFLNDEDWGLRPWAAKKMDPEFHNIGPRTYERIFELLLRLRANTLWPAMHPGTRPFNATVEDAVLADKWGIVMGSSHSEALLRNNVGEWNEKTDGPWNYQVNRVAIDHYWDQRLAANGHYENLYTVGMRGVHDSGLEATGSPEVKARLVETVMDSQRAMLAQHVAANLRSVPQILWLYKESLDLYRAGMKVPDDVTLGWTDDNFGYLRQLPNAEEQRRSGGSGIYYHVSYWGRPHDYLWLCTTPPALIREEMSKAYDHGARRFWILNVGDIKPAESDIDYFLQLAWNEPESSRQTQMQFLHTWAAEQFGESEASAIAAIWQRYYELSFVRKPEFMGFNGYDDGIRRTAFNPLGWGDQNHTRLTNWQQLATSAMTEEKHLPAAMQDAYFELVAYPVEAAAAQVAKFLWTDRSFLDASQAGSSSESVHQDAKQAHAAYAQIQTLTAHYNSLASGKWDGMMSASPRDRSVFAMPKTALDTPVAVPSSWQQGTPGSESATLSFPAADFAERHDGDEGKWTTLPELGFDGGALMLSPAGSLSSARWAQVADPNNATPSPQDAWLEYHFNLPQSIDATLELHLLPTFPVDSEHRLRYAVALDDDPVHRMDASGSGEWKEDGAAPTWELNVLRNSAVATLPFQILKAGPHRLRLYYGDPGVVFQNIVIRPAGSPPAYPLPPAHH